MESIENAFRKKRSPEELDQELGRLEEAMDNHRTNQIRAPAKQGSKDRKSYSGLKNTLTVAGGIITLVGAVYLGARYHKQVLVVEKSVQDYIQLVYEK